MAVYGNNIVQIIVRLWDYITVYPLMFRKEHFDIWTDVQRDIDGLGYNLVIYERAGYPVPQGPRAQVKSVFITPIIFLFRHK